MTPEVYVKRYRRRYGRKVFGGKTVLIRAGIDVPVNAQGRLAGWERIRLAIPTINELSDYGAKVVVLGHQGRAGKGDFIELDQHARMIRKLINQPRGRQKERCTIAAT